MRNSEQGSSRIITAWRAIKSHRQQIGVVLLSLTLGLVIILNVAMVPAVGPVNDPNRRPIQFSEVQKSEIQKKVPTPPVILR